MNLKKKRIEKKLKVCDVAQYLGVSEMTIYYYESGKRKICVEKLKRLAMFYKCPINDLID